MQLQDVKAIVTGAASGIGRAFLLELARSGACVVGGDVNVEGLRAVAMEATDLPGQVLTAYLDVSQEASVKSFVLDIRQQIGTVNTLVNNAGILRDGLLVSKEDSWIKKMPTVQWQRVIDVNLTGPFLMSREVVAAMLEDEVSQGLIVNISSATRFGNAGQSNYAASKSGLDADTRTWALELAKYGIRVGAISPGVIDTPILNRVSEEAKEELISKIPVGRIGTPYEIWLALKFIIECDFFTGRVIEVDGGANF